MTRIVISSGHGKYVRGASGILDEVDEARLVVEQLAGMLRDRGVAVVTFHDDISHSQNENLETIVDFHNSHTRDLDISVHFNAYEQTDRPMGCEVLYLTAGNLAAKLSAAIAAVGLIDRGAKQRTDLYVLNNTDMPAVLLEVAFVDSSADAVIYYESFDEICNNLASVLGGDSVAPAPEPEALGLYVIGTVSCFGGPDDNGVAPDEGLALIDNIDDAPQLFLPFQPEGTSGLARRLNPFIHYVACRWDYAKTPKEALLQDLAMVRAVTTGRALTAFPADWGPHENTGRVADISPGLMKDLGITTDDVVEVVFPYDEQQVLPFPDPI
jgi:N-acetylmuramoyl-L-alanine amidase